MKDLSANLMSFSGNGAAVSWLKIKDLQKMAGMQNAVLVLRGREAGNREKGTGIGMARDCGYCTWFEFAPGGGNNVQRISG